MTSQDIITRLERENAELKAEIQSLRHQSEWGYCVHCRENVLYERVCPQCDGTALKTKPAEQISLGL